MEVISASEIDSAVAPLAGAWIEILLEWSARNSDGVAPLAGAWIEIIIVSCNVACQNCRAPRGRVD